MTVRKPTPVRTCGTRAVEGWILLRDHESSYADGAEAALYEILVAAPDVSLAADALIADARTWPERYHLDPARANVLRGLAIPANARILEIGAGCGAVTRYLGEMGASVDALEPVPSRARVARERCRDLPNVEVFVGELEDVPARAAYDIVVVVGVLEYVGHGSSDLDVYRTFLKDIEVRLVSSGSLILAIENKLGVKYLVGAPEDHTNRVFDSIESYPTRGPARTFSRRELEGLFTSVGLVPRTIGAFPDYKMTRAIMAPENFPVECTSLLHCIPTFPSPDWRSPRPRLADERLVWKSLVDAGMAADTPNSFVVLAGKGRSSNLWPDDLAAAYFSTGRRASWSTATRVRVSGGSLRFQRERLYPEVSANDLTMRTYEEPLVEGTDFVSFSQTAADEALTAALVGWSDLVRVTAASTNLIPLDLIPHNTAIREDGSLRAFDQEWYVPQNFDYCVEDVLRRGVLWLAGRLAFTTPPERWPTCTTVGDLAAHLGSMVSLPADGTWIATALDKESWLQARVHRKGSGMTETDWADLQRRELEKLILAPLAGGPLGERDFEALVRVRAELDRWFPEIGAALRDGDSASLSALRVYYRIATALTPPGSLRRRAFSKITRGSVRLARTVRPSRRPRDGA